jgi:hypothetical protein
MYTNQIIIETPKQGVELQFKLVFLGYFGHITIILRFIHTRVRLIREMWINYEASTNNKWS